MVELTINNEDKKFLKIAVEQARESVNRGGFPAGAVVVRNGEIISKGVSLGFKLNDLTSHAETVSIREACKVLRTIDLSGATLYASLQPCLLCFSAANWAGISKIVYGCGKNNQMVSKGYYEGKNEISEVNKNNNRQIELVYIPDFESEMLELVSEWEKNQNE